MKVFGPVPSRRLGRSLGINNIPPKLCTYSCVYCQLGRTRRMEVRRVPFYEPREILQETEEKIAKIRKIGLSVDYLTFVADGEPTLDVNLGREIEMFQPLGIKVAVITNGSLISLEDVREDLARADWVSLKVDCTQEDLWLRINRPKQTLQLKVILNGMLEFARAFKGELVTETMLVRDVNNNKDCLQRVAEFLERLQPAKAYVSIPTRPPTEKWVEPPDEEGVNEAYQIFTEHLDKVECLTGYETTDFSPTGDPSQDILSITAVHPMHEQAVKAFLLQAKADWSMIERLINQGQLIKLNYQGKRFYTRRHPKK